VARGEDADREVARSLRSRKSPAGAGLFWFLVLVQPTTNNQQPKTNNAARALRAPL
jgi:hypothetical protein